MTYATKEQSTSSGSPFECYKFETPLGDFRYTTLPENVTLGGEVYLPRVITRTAAEINSIIDTLQTMDFHVPITDALAQAYASNVVPDYLTASVFRAHVGDDLSTEFVTEWKGEATTYAYDAGRNALVISTQSILQAKVQGPANMVYVQLACNHRVYDDRCQLDEEDFSVTTEVTAFDNISITVDNDNYPDHELAIGKVTNDRTGEERTIFDNVANVLTITYPFKDLVIGDPMTLTLGCNNTLSICKARFDNVVHFGGFRYVPLTNIFVDNGDSTVTTTTSSRTRVVPEQPFPLGESGHAS